MTYDELMQSILTAQEEMLKHKVEANSVTLNGRRYGKLIEGYPPNMKPTIFGMAVKADYTMPDDYDFLVQYEPPQPQTNGDRLRAMTDEELARFITDDLCELLCGSPSVCDGNCEGKMLLWLKSPTDTEGER